MTAMAKTRQQNRPHNNSSSSSNDPILLPSLLWPWLLVVAVGIVGALWTTTFTNDDTTNEYMLSESLSYSRWLQKAGKYVFDEEHKALFPLSSVDYTGFGLAILGLMVAAGGGIGGGGILVPIYILVWGFSPKHAIPLSNVTVFGGAVANTVLNTPKRHPHADRPLVDWDLILVMEPLTIAGALIGAFLNKLLPEQLLTLLLVLLLSFTAHKTLGKALKMYKREGLAIQRQQQQQMNHQTENSSPESELTKITHQQRAEEAASAKDELLENMELQEGESPGDGSITSPPTATQELEQLLDEERTTPRFNLQVLIVMFVVVLIVNMMKGGGAFPSPLGIRCGSQSFWIANLILLAWIFAVSLVARSHLLKKYYLKERLGFKYVEGDIRWDPRATIVYPVVCCLAGFFAGMFGIGGGIVKGPLMLAMGVHPSVSSASSACMILFTSFTATTSFVVFGLLVPDYAVVCLVVGFCATYAGQIGLTYLMKRYQRNSYIAFSIGGVVLLSAFLMTIQSLVSMAEKSNQQHHTGGICGKDD